MQAVNDVQNDGRQLSPPETNSSPLPALPCPQVKPVREPAEWVGKAAESTSSSVQRATSTSIRRVIDDIKTLANVSAQQGQWQW